MRDGFVSVLVILVGFVLMAIGASSGLENCHGPEVDSVVTPNQDRQNHIQMLRQRIDSQSDVISFSKRYDIDAGLAQDIYWTAREVGIDPEIAFRLVQEESSFRPQVVSEVGAIGLTQIKLSTARTINPDVEKGDLFDPTMNLRYGLFYLRRLLRRFDGNYKRALLAYNQGPTRVALMIARGANPENGYADSVLYGLDLD